MSEISQKSRAAPSVKPEDTDRSMERLVRNDILGDTKV